MKYTVVIEKTDSGYGAFVPDLPGCVAVAESRVEVERLIKEAIGFHLEGLKAEGETVPPPCCEVVQVDVEAA